MGRQRVEALHPELVPEVLRVARKHAMNLFSVSDKAADRALARHYAGQLMSQLAAERSDVEVAMSEVCKRDERIAKLTEAAINTNAENESLKAQLKFAIESRDKALDGLRCREQNFFDAEAEIEVLKADLRAARLEVEDLRDKARVGHEPYNKDDEIEELREQLAVATVALSLTDTKLYSVQAMTTLAQVESAVREGAALGTLQHQLVAVRPVYVYDAETPTLQVSTMLSLGACVCTQDGLDVAGLPIPKGTSW